MLTLALLFRTFRNKNEDDCSSRRQMFIVYYVPGIVLGSEKQN